MSSSPISITKSSVLSHIFGSVFFFHQILLFTHKHTQKPYFIVLILMATNDGSANNTNSASSVKISQWTTKEFKYEDDGDNSTKPSLKTLFFLRMVASLEIGVVASRSTGFLATTITTMERRSKGFSDCWPTHFRSRNRRCLWDRTVLMVFSVWISLYLA